VSAHDDDGAPVRTVTLGPQILDVPEWLAAKLALVTAGQSDHDVLVLLPTSQVGVGVQIVAGGKTAVVVQTQALVGIELFNKVAGTALMPSGPQLNQHVAANVIGLRPIAFVGFVMDGRKLDAATVRAEDAVEDRRTVPDISTRMSFFLDDYSPDDSGE